MIAFIKLAFQIIARVLQAYNNYKLKQVGRNEMQLENDKIIESEIRHAENIRSHDLPDNILLQPEERDIGGLPGLPANICGEQKGSGGNCQTSSQHTDQTAQCNLGKELFIKPGRKVTKAFLHCSASDNPAHDNVETIREWHLARRFADIGYHFYINKHGQILKGRNIKKIPASQRGKNTGTIAICCGGEKLFSDVQLKALKDFCLEINLAYDGEISFHGHCEIEPNKLCPAYDYKKLLNLDEAGKITGGEKK